MDIIAVGAHPDDVEIGMGGTIAAFVAAGHKVLMLDISNGEPTPRGTPEIRMQEAAAAVKCLGASRITMDIKNREIMDTVENRTKLATVFREHKPRILFVPYWEDGHPDHIETSKLAVAARFYAKFVKTDMPFEPHYPGKVFYYYVSHLRIKMNPSFVFDSSQFHEKKLKALSCYKSQFEDNEKNLKVLDNVSQNNKYWGNQIRSGCGEPFYCQENIRIAAPGSLFDA